MAQARARGIYTVIDGDHTPGHIALSLNALGADFYAGNCHKWLMAPKGSAFLHVRPEFQAMINPPVISHGWTADAREPGAKGPFGNTPFIDGLEIQGTRDPAAWLSVPAAIAFRKDHEWSKLARQCRILAEETAPRVAKMTGLPPFASPVFCAPQMVAMPIPACDTQNLQQTLLERHMIEVPCFNWKFHSIVRISAQAYNTQAHMDRLVTALGGLLPGP